MTTPSTADPAWSAGAHSTTQLVGDGWFSFGVTVGTVGAVVGLSVQDASTNPSEPSHGFSFESGQFRIVESGAKRTPSATFSADDVFAIVRRGDTIYYCRGAAGGSYRHAQVPFALPGEVIYTSAVKNTADVLLDAALRMGGDRVVGAALVLVAGVSAALEPLQACGSDVAVAEVAVSLEPMQAQAHNGKGVFVALEPLLIAAAQEEYNAVNVLLEPMQVQAWDGASAIRGAYLQMEPMDASASGPGMSTDRVTATFPTLQVAAAQDARAEVSIQLEEMRLLAYGLGSPALGLHITATLPAFSGAQSSFADVYDVALASDATYPSHYTLVTDGALAGDELIAGAVSVNDLEDAALASDAVMVGTSMLLEDGALAGDELPPTVSDVLLQDAAWASSEVMAQSDGAVLLEDGALASDAALPYAFADVTDGALAGDDALIATVALLEDAAVADDETLTASLQGPALLEDVAIASDEVTHWTRSVALLQDTAVASEQLFMKTPGLVAWVMNTDTGAVSWYDNWAFTSIAVVGGKVFAAGPDGLHVLGGELDGAETIDARMQFGYAEFGGYDRDGMPKPNEQKKRLGGLWFGYHAGGELQATVETYGQGYGPHTYAMAARAADQPRNNRIVPGKGLNARYWRIAVANTAGCDFEVHSIAAEVAASNRRI